MIIAASPFSDLIMAYKIILTTQTQSSKIAFIVNPVFFSWQAFSFPGLSAIHSLITACLVTLIRLV